MDTIRSLRCFVRAVELGSLSAVAREEGTTQPTVSKLMAALERELGVRLLERSTTSLQPTPQGSRFYQRALGVLAEYQEAVAEVRGQTETPAGLIRVNAPAAFGQFRLNALLAPFLARYPQVDIELILDDRMVDLVKEGVGVPDPAKPGQTNTQFLRYVELEISGNTAPLVSALSNELGESAPMKKRWYGGSSSTLYQDFPVTITAPPFLRIRWNVFPGAKAFLEALRPYAVISETVSLTHDFAHLQSLSRDAQ